jgi:uncharacterized protein with NRDE domain
MSKEFPLVLGANRDEFYQRPTAAMHFWEDPPNILAGKDLEQGGTWFGLGRNGSFAALTNYRNPAALKPEAPSRGEIIPEFLGSEQSPEDFIRDFTPKANAYNGFNLILGNPDRLFWFTNVTCKMEEIGPGIHGLSNRFLNTPWPKVESGKKALENVIQGPVTPDQLFSILKDSTVPGDPSLPDTGVGLEWERILSPLFIESPDYGTRSSIAMLVDQKKNINITERTYSDGNRPEPKDCHFLIPGCHRT